MSFVNLFDVVDHHCILYALFKSYICVPFSPIVVCSLFFLLMLSLSFPFSGRFPFSPPTELCLVLNQSYTVHITRLIYVTYFHIITSQSSFSFPPPCILHARILYVQSDCLRIKYSKLPFIEMKKCLFPKLISD